MPSHMRRNTFCRGWTLAELLIAVAIIALIVIALLWNTRTQIARGFDAKRKADLTSIHKAFEEYYNDNDCYPAPGILDDCGGSALSPYLAKVPCDPVTKQPYKYVPESNPCLGFRTCAALQDTADPAITGMGCDPMEGCGWGAGYNYCASSGVPVVAPGFVPGVGGTGGAGGTTPTSTPGAPGTTPTPTPTPAGTLYACAPAGQGCNVYSDPASQGCPRWWGPPGCPAGECSNPDNWCLQ